VKLEDRTCQPSQIIGKLFLIGRQLADLADLDLIEAVAMQVDTKISHYHAMKRTLSYALAPTQVEFFVRRPQIANWFFQTPHLEEVAMVFVDICSYTAITQRLNDPSITVEVAREWITREAQLVSQFGGYFDKEAGDCVICHFGPPFFELTLDTLVSVHDFSELETLMREYPSDPERAAYRAVMLALASHAMIKEFTMGGTPLSVAVGIEVDRVAIGNLTGRLGSVTAMGTGMNMAARLQGFAGPGETIIGPNCRRRLEGYRRSNLRKDLPFVIEPGEEVALKGFERPVVYSLVTSR
jgi:class 3 adenylate cyclase